MSPHRGAAADSARWPASFSRCASPPESVGTGWPSRRYSRPTSASGAQRAATSSLAGEERERLGRPSSRARRRCCGRSTCTSSTSGAEAPAVAVGAAQVHVGEELHLDVLEAVAAAGRAAAVAGVEAERARRVAALLRERRARRSACGSRRTRRRSSPGSSASSCRSATGRRARRRRRARSPRSSRCAPGASVGLPLRFAARRSSTSCTSVDLPEPETPVTHTRRLQRERDVDVLQVVLGGAEELDRRTGSARAPAAMPPSARLRPERYSAVSVFARCSSSGVPEEHDLAAALARTRAHVEDAVGGEHDLRVVLDDDERVARVAQPLHHVDHAAHVARMQADRRLVQHEQRVDERGAERGGEVDPLHLAAGERARLAVEREVAEAHLGRDSASRARISVKQQLGRFVERRRQVQLLEERRQRSIGSSMRSWIVRPGARERASRSAPCGRKRVAPSADPHPACPEPPQQRVGLEPRAVAGAHGVYAR